MSDRELIDALRTKGERRAMELWTEAEEEARRLREEMEARLQKARKEITRHLEHFEDKEVAVRLQQAREESRQIVLEAEHALARRCYQLAVEMLKSLGDEDRSMLLQRLAEELPEASWEAVTVNPQDRKKADKLFPQLEVRTEDSVSAGFAIETANRKIAINNTMEMRLQRSWPFLLPELLHSIRDKLDVQESSENQDL